MFNIKSIYYCFLLFVIVNSLPACNKEEFLNASPGSEMIIPATLEDLQRIIDNVEVFEGSPSLTEASAGDYYIPDFLWPTFSLKDQHMYLWVKELFKDEKQIADWNQPYKQVFYANTILETLAKIPVTNDNEKFRNNIRGSALFLRSYAFINLASSFAMIYDSTTFETSWGIPLKLNTDFKEKLVRASVRETWDQILNDLQQSALLLPEAFPVQYKNRPSRLAALALLSRTYLSLGIYDKAWLYADSCLRLNNTLLDYNQANANSIYPFALINNETLYQSTLINNSEIITGLILGACLVDATLYNEYADSDLRKQLFFLLNFEGKPYFKGSYHGDAFLFSGLATNELFLIRSECYARAGNTSAAMTDLNHLLQYRYKSGSFTPLSANDPQEALSVILTERRKELIFRGLRWSDLKRLNKEGAGIILTRQLNGQVYELLPNDARYIFPIPPDILQGTTMPQNPR